MMNEVVIPEGVEVNITKTTVNVKGPKGEVTKMFKVRGLKLSVDNGKVMINAPNKAICNTITTHIKNMINGVLNPYVKKLIIRYHHFPITVEVKGKEIFIKNYLGERYPRKCKIHGDAKVEVKGNMIYVTSPDKEAVGQTAYNIKKVTRSKLDRRVFQDGIYDVLEE